MRVKGGNVSKKRHKKVLKLVKGHRAGAGKIITSAMQSMMKALRYAYRHRREKKREFRRLWITRINAAARMNGLSYSQLINGLKLADIDINRKMLSDLAISDPATFSNIVNVAKEKLASLKATA
ncbi:MAG: 50S ribosomal protein L20 [Candidatus Sericytochromatia bacterium]|nr:MAG: 50S ribosomal protein L20 [Candidatus Sericytochromatia bacterium]